MEDQDDEVTSSTPGNNGKNGVKIVVAIIVVIALLGFFVLRPKNSTSSPQVSGASTEKTAVDPNGTYKDGTYNARGSYQSPAGSESIDVELTLKDGVISDVTVTGDGLSPTSKEYQGKFIDGVKNAVVGKKINGLKLDRVAGSSLTPKGFDNALSQIQTQAKA